MSSNSHICGRHNGPFTSIAGRNGRGQSSVEKQLQFDPGMQASNYSSILLPFQDLLPRGFLRCYEPLLIGTLRCCKAVFRHAKNFHRHKLNVCRAYHKPATPTYEQILALQDAVAAEYGKDRPSTSKQLLINEEMDLQLEMSGDQSDVLDVYDGMEEFCGDTESPEPGEFIDDQENESGDDGMSDTVEEGEYIEGFTASKSPTTSSSTKSVDLRNDSNADPLEQMDSSSDGSDAISLPESPPPDGHLSFPIFSDQLLESPTDSDYFGKGEKISALSLLLPVAQMEHF
ncbi:C2H2-type domain-containing protein [Trichostrongylus colubriformis]|uniref:C2H2-type domain-containing protein n=1 Tax=Trichostrongylus colubriformis TaxID=6319 RepID=A0AAN8F588_TRICO